MAIELAKANAPSGVLERAVLIMRIVSGSGGDARVREVARQSGLPVSTTGRLVQQMVELGLLTRTDFGIALGQTLAELQPTRHGPNELQRLRPLLLDLVAEIGESAALSVDGETSVLYIDQVASANPVSVATVVESRHPFHLVAPGLALMATWSANRLDDYLHSELSATTRHSVAEPEKIRKRMVAVRQTGLVWAIEELDLEVTGLATTLRFTDHNPTTSTVAVSIYGPSYRLSLAKATEVADQFVATVSRFVERLGDGLETPF